MDATPHLWKIQGGIQSAAPESDCCPNCLVTSNYLLKGNMSAWKYGYKLNPKHLYGNLAPTATTLIGYNWIVFFLPRQARPDKQQLQAKNSYRTYNHVHMSIAICIYMHSSENIQRLRSRFLNSNLNRCLGSHLAQKWPSTINSLSIPNEANASLWFVYALVQNEKFYHCPVQSLNENFLLLSGSWCFSCLARANKQISLCPWLKRFHYCRIATAIISLRGFKLDIPHPGFQRKVPFKVTSCQFRAIGCQHKVQNYGWHLKIKLIISVSLSHPSTSWCSSDCSNFSNTALQIASPSKRAPATQNPSLSRKASAPQIASRSY